MDIVAFTKTGNKATGNLTLDGQIFEVVPKNHDLLKANYVAYLSNARSNDAMTKTRGMISGADVNPIRKKALAGPVPVLAVTRFGAVAARSLGRPALKTIPIKSIRKLSAWQSAKC